MLLPRELDPLAAGAHMPLPLAKPPVPPPLPPTKIASREKPGSRLDPKQQAMSFDQRHASRRPPR